MNAETEPKKHVVLPDGRSLSWGGTWYQVGRQVSSTEYIPGEGRFCIEWPAVAEKVRSLGVNPETGALI